MILALRVSGLDRTGKLEAKKGKLRIYFGRLGCVGKTQKVV